MRIEISRDLILKKIRKGIIGVRVFVGGITVCVSVFANAQREEFVNVGIGQNAFQFNFYLQQKMFNAKKSLGCANFRNEFWNQLVDYVIDTESVPDATSIWQAWDFQLRTKMEVLADSNDSSQGLVWQELREEFRSLIQTIFMEAQAQGLIQSYSDLAEILVGLDMGDETTEFKAGLKPFVAEVFDKIEKHILALGISCDIAPHSGYGMESDQGKNQDQEPPSRQERNKQYRGLAPLVFGARWAMATAYQTCQSIHLNPLNATTPNLEGITKKCCHSDGIGNKRYISNLNKVQESHPYIRRVALYDKQCFRVVDNPLIYDYGGRPKIRTESSQAPFDLFTNAGSGTSVLGIDCSAYVFLSMATAGLRVAPNRALRGSDIYGPTSHSFLNPQQNGMTCLDRITITPNNSMRAGDIASVRGHTFIIDSVGDDPLGIANARSVKDCDHLSSENFNFTIAQSSSSKNGVGINRFKARDYMQESDKIRIGFLKYAKAACLAKVHGQTAKPNYSEFSIVRHNGREECFNSRLRIVKDSCIEACDLNSN